MSMKILTEAVIKEIYTYEYVKRNIHIRICVQIISLKYNK